MTLVPLLLPERGLLLLLRVLRLRRAERVNRMIAPINNKHPITIRTTQPAGTAAAAVTCATAAFDALEKKRMAKIKTKDNKLFDAFITENVQIKRVNERVLYLQTT